VAQISSLTPSWMKLIDSIQKAREGFSASTVFLRKIEGSSGWKDVSTTKNCPADVLQLT
jgi:hypothetical protein